MTIKRLFDAVERRGDIGRRVAALVLPVSNGARVASGCAGKIGLREPGEHPTGPNLASRDNVAHDPILYTILQTPPPGTLIRVHLKVASQSRNVRRLLRTCRKHRRLQTQLSSAPVYRAEAYCAS